MTTSLDSYNNLVAAIQAWLVDRTDLVTQIPGFLRMGELRIYRELRIAAMETTFSETFATDAVTIPVPDDYLELEYLNVVTTTPIIKLTRQTPEYISTMFPLPAAKGIPQYFARSGNVFIFGPNPATTYTLSGIYFAALPALSATNQTNWFTQNAGDLLLNAALTQAIRYLRDDANLAMAAEQEYQRIKEDIIRADLAERRSGSTRVGRYIPR